MPILNWAVDVSDFSNIDPSASLSGTTSSGYRLSTVDRAFSISQNGCDWVELDCADTSDLWLSLGMYSANPDNDNNAVIEFIHDDGTTAHTLLMIGRPVGVSSATLGAFTYDGSAYTEVIPIGAINMQTFPAEKKDIHVNLNAAGVIELFEDGVLTGSYSGNTITNGGLATVNRVRISYHSINQTLFVSGIFLADEDTRNIFIDQAKLNAAGTHQDQDYGTFADIDSAGTVDDATAVGISGSGSKATFGFDALTSTFSTGYEVVGIGVSARLKKNGQTAAQFNLAARGAATDAASAPISATENFSNYKHVFTVNPDTGAAWTFTEADAAEVGIEVS